MPSKNKAGCVCCGGCAEVDLDAAGEWTEVGDGTVTGSISGLDLTLEGEVNPGSFVSSEAYEINFTLVGKVVITIDSVAYTVDTAAQTVSDGTTTASIGRSAGTSIAEVWLRTTPTHTYLIAEGNYEVASGQKAHGIVIKTRSSNPATTFTCVWGSGGTPAYVWYNFTISEAKVVVASSGDDYYELLCWSPPPVSCNYSVCKSVTNNHEWYGVASYGTYAFDWYMPNLTIDDGGAIAKAFIDDCYPKYEIIEPVVGAWELTDPLESFQVDAVAPQAFGAGPTQGFSGGTPCSWYGYIGRWYKWLASMPYEFQYLPYFACGGSCSLDFGTPSVSTPYPVPKYVATFGIDLGIDIKCCWNGSEYVCGATGTSGGSVSSDIDCNDIEAGFTLSVTGVVDATTYDGRTGTYSDYECSKLGVDCVTYEPVTVAELLADVNPVSGTWTV